MDFSKVTNYQDPEGTFKDRKKWAPRTDLRKDMINWDLVKDRTVLDIGCNNGYFVREAMKHGAKRAVGVDVSSVIPGAREYADAEGAYGAEFWQVSADSKEFRKFCPRFDVVFVLSVITHLRDKEDFLDWLDSRVKWLLIFESNHGEPNKKHIELVKKHMWFDEIKYLGPSDIPEKPHYLWECYKSNHEIRYPGISDLEVEWIPIDKIVGFSEEDVMKQKSTYSLDSEKFQRLKADIKERGIRDPILVKGGVGSAHGTYKAFNGGHRYLAAKQLGYKDVPCKVLWMSN